VLVEQVAHPSRFAVVDSWESGAKNACFAPFYTKNDHFAKTGSGQTWGKLEQRGVFSAGCWHSSQCSCGAPYGEKNWPSPPQLARLPNVLPLPGMAMRDAKWWEGTLGLVAANLDAVVRGTALTHVVRNGSSAANPQCAHALTAACGVAKRASKGNCLLCVSSAANVQKFEAAHCEQGDISQFC
jgi:hypothetical protein